MGLERMAGFTGIHIFLSSVHQCLIHDLLAGAFAPMRGVSIQRPQLNNSHVSFKSHFAQDREGDGLALSSAAKSRTNGGVRSATLFVGSHGRRTVTPQLGLNQWTLRDKQNMENSSVMLARPRTIYLPSSSTPQSAHPSPATAVAPTARTPRGIRGPARSRRPLDAGGWAGYERAR